MYVLTNNRQRQVSKQYPAPRKTRHRNHNSATATWPRNPSDQYRPASHQISVRRRRGCYPRLPGRPAKRTADLSLPPWSPGQSVPGWLWAMKGLHPVRRNNRLSRPIGVFRVSFTEKIPAFLHGLLSSTATGSGDEDRTRDPSLGKQAGSILFREFRVDGDLPLDPGCRRDCM